MFWTLPVRRAPLCVAARVSHEYYFLNYRRIVPTRLMNGGVCPAWSELG